MITIERAKLSDINAIADMIQLMADTTERLHLSSNSCAAYVSEVIRKPYNRMFYIAKVDGEVVGCLRLDQVDDELRGQRNWWISDLYVDPPQRRKGIATELLKYVADVASREPIRPHLKLQITTDNKNARLLYYNFGFRTNEVRTMELSPYLTKK